VTTERQLPDDLGDPTEHSLQLFTDTFVQVAE
jgi:hypothetical protein